jgi:sulfur carrier protein
MNEIIVNGEPMYVAPDTTLGALIDGFGKGRAGVAVARNDEVVPRSAWDGERVVAGDRIEVLSAARGG